MAIVCSAHHEVDLGITRIVFAYDASNKVHPKSTCEAAARAYNPCLIPPDTAL
jgi:hypothetical protein